MGNYNPKMIYILLEFNKNYALGVKLLILKVKSLIQELITLLVLLVLINYLSLEDIIHQIWDLMMLLYLDQMIIPGCNHLIKNRANLKIQNQKLVPLNQELIILAFTIKEKFTFLEVMVVLVTLESHSMIFI